MKPFDVASALEVLGLLLLMLPFVAWIVGGIHYEIEEWRARRAAKKAREFRA